MLVLCPSRSGLAFSVQYEEPYCFADPYAVEDICNKTSSLLDCETVQQKSKLTEKFDQLKEKYDDASLKWVSSL
jgi:hypothetical protein